MGFRCFGNLHLLDRPTNDLPTCCTNYFGIGNNNTHLLLSRPNFLQIASASRLLLDEGCIHKGVITVLVVGLVMDSL
eukprot:jgi/Psemu1/307831/fgenesh1_kg.357_\